MAAEPAPARFDATAMLQAARGRGFDRSRRLLTDWVSLGLLDRPQKKGLGKGRGTTATWSAEQRELFLQLLEKRATVSTVGPLCNIPVWLWLYYGEQYVPLRQVRRALGTWGGANRKTSASWRDAGKIAGQITDQLDHPEATPRARRELREEICKGIYNVSIDREALLQAAKEVFDPKSTGHLRGPVGAQISAERFVQVVEARMMALGRLNDAPDELFEWARSAYLQTQAEYAHELKTFARDPDLGHLHRPQDLNEVVNRACINLLTLIGLGLQREGATTT